MKTTVIYHSADFDGIFCREIARKFIPDAELIGWNFGDPRINVELHPDRALYVDHKGKFLGRFDKIYILDLSPECLESPSWDGWMDRVIWIDHHKTSIEKWPSTIPGYRIDGVAACRLAWQWFTMVDGNAKRVVPIRPAGVLPMIHDYKNREVNEPLAVLLAGEYDIWDKRDPRAETFQYALRSVDLDDPDYDWWGKLLTLDDGWTQDLAERGQRVQRYAQQTDASICKSRTWIMEWEGLKFLCVNSARFNSLLFAVKDVPETGHDALMGFCFDGKCWSVSLYHAKHRTDMDLSAIAKKHGGGGHRGACGFTTKTIPFSLL